MSVKKDLNLANIEVLLPSEMYVLKGGQGRTRTRTSGSNTSSSTRTSGGSTRTRTRSSRKKS